MQNQYMGKQLKDLQTSIDSMTVRLDSIKAINSKNVYDMSYKKTFSKPKRELSQQAETGTGNTATANDADSLTKISNEPVKIINFDSLYKAEAPSGQAALLVRAKSNIESVKADYYFKAATLGDEAYKVRRHLTEWHKKFTLSFACMVLSLIHI